MEKPAKTKDALTRAEKAEVDAQITRRLTDALAMPPAIALAGDILACLHDLNGFCALCGKDIEDEMHQGDCPLIRHAGLFELAARLRKKKGLRLYPRRHVMAPLSANPDMIEAGAKALEAAHFGDRVEMVVMAILTAALRTLAPAFSLEMELEEELALDIALTRAG